jgi:hypothetical protein
MKLPKRGLLVNPGGELLWVWEHNDPTTEFNSLPPPTITMEGDTPVASSQVDAGAVVIDLEVEGLEPGDMAELHREHRATRIRRRPDGSIRITRVIGLDAHGNEVEVEHPVVDMINLRRMNAGRPPLKKGP